MAKKQQTKGKQGFASMDEEKQREIASKGGKKSHKGEQPDVQGESDDEDNGHEGKGKQGFASMDKEKVREIASKGGKSSHRGAADDDATEEDEDSEHEEKGKQGFASMDKGKVREIASKGGKTSDRSDADDEGELEDGVSEKIYSLIDILQEDLTAVDIDMATSAIDEWHQQLKGSKDKELKQIATSLKNLKKLVTSDEADPSEIAEILISLGEQIGGYASNADENISDPLSELAASLTDAGESLE